MIFLIILSLLPQKETVKVKHLPGYTVISYDKVMWSDGRIVKYDWHKHKLK